MTPFGTLKTGETVHAITLGNATLTATILTFGAILQDLRLSGVAHPLTLGFTDIAPYEDNRGMFGAIVAPVVNRIAGGTCAIAGKTHTFATIEDGNTLHSGPTGSHSQVWQVAARTDTAVTLTLDQPDGQGGFPGNRTLTAIYTLTDNTLTLTIGATTDAPTLMNPAHHGYWNLDGTPTWEGHSLQIHADRYLPGTDASLPTGEIAAVENTPYDLRAPTPLMTGTAPVLDTNFCLADGRGPLRDALSLIGATGTRLDIATTEPGVQVFDAAPIDAGSAPTIHGHRYGPRCGIAIEPQAWPNAPHNPDFPSIELNPGDPFRQETSFRFSKG